MYTVIERFVLRGCVVVLATAVGCGESPSAPGPMVDGGSWYVSGFRWPHDGRPFESDHFIIFSDGASDPAKRELAAMSEEALEAILARFELTDTDLLRFPPGQEKIHAFAYKHYYPEEWGGRAYYGGFMIYSLDHPQRSAFGHTAPEMYVPVVTHELVHVVTSLIKASGNPDLVDVWLTEGIAEAISGGTAGGVITDWARVTELTATYGWLNPIAMRQYRFPAIEGVAFEYYYPMFQLAATWLFDPDGHGRSWVDLRELLLDVRDGVDFAEAFEDHLAIARSRYEAEFFDLMHAYLR